MEYRVDRHGDTTITLREIKINNIEQWDKLSVNDLIGYRADAVDLIDSVSEVEQQGTETSLMSHRRSNIIKLDEVDLERTTSSMGSAS